MTARRRARPADTAKDTAAPCPSGRAGVRRTAAVGATTRERAVLAAALDPIVTIDDHGTIDSASDSVERVFGWTARELVGRNIAVLMPEPHRSAHDGYLTNYRATAQTNILGRTRQFEGVRKNGEVFPLELSVARADPPGGRTLFVGILRDVSGRVRLERELRLVLDLALSISGASNLASALVATIRLISTATQWEYGEAWVASRGEEELEPAAAWARPGSALEGFERTMRGVRFRRGAGLPGRAWETGLTAWSADLSESELGRADVAGATGVGGAAVVPILSQNAAIAVLVFLVFPTRQEDPNLLELVRSAVAPLGTLIQRKRAEDELEEYRRGLEARVAERTLALQESQDKLRLADRLASIGTLAAGLGHDMNNVLLPVRARLNALRAEGTGSGASAAARAHVEEIRKSVAYLQQLADGLHFLVMDPEQGDDSQHSVDLAAWWSVAGALLAKAVPKHVRVNASFAAGLPPVVATEQGLTQAVLNLVVNAGEAIPPPAERKRRQGIVRISASAERGEDGEPRVRLSVADNGHGMTEEVRRRAFEMFYTTRPRGLGTGLGLALVRKVADRAGASIAIDTKIGQGTTVSIDFRAAMPRTAGSGGRAAAVVSIGDGRAAAMVHHLLEASGMLATMAGEPGDADIWVVEPSATNLVIAEGWLARRPRGRVVCFGSPAGRSRRSWRAVGSVMIEDTADLESIQAAIDRVITHL